MVRKVSTGGTAGQTHVFPVMVEPGAPKITIAPSVWGCKEISLQSLARRGEELTASVTVFPETVEPLQAREIPSAPFQSQVNSAREIQRWERQKGGLTFARPIVASVVATTELVDTGRCVSRGSDIVVRDDHGRAISVRSLNEYS